MQIAGELNGRAVAPARRAWRAPPSIGGAELQIAGELDGRAVAPVRHTWRSPGVAGRVEPKIGGELNGCAVAPDRHALRLPVVDRRRRVADCRRVQRPRRLSRSPRLALAPPSTGGVELKPTLRSVRKRLCPKAELRKTFATAPPHVG